MKKSIAFIMFLAVYGLGACAESTDDSRNRNEAERTPANNVDDMGTTTTGVGTTGTSGTPTISGGTDTTGTGMRDTIR